MSKLYRGISGTKYKYDLNKPMDIIAYSSDLGAQLNDRLNSLTPDVQFDKTNGQNGGGIVDKKLNSPLDFFKGKK